MLLNLKIKNIALIEEVNIDFQKGLTVLTGETGAGKSIIIDALNFVLGERADKSLIRSGQPNAKVDAIFYLDNEEHIRSIFETLGIEFEQPIILSRTMSVSQVSECRVNGQIVTLSMLKQISNALVDIHGQQEHQVILNVKNHLNILDSYCGEKISLYKDNIKKYIEELKLINNEIASLGGNSEERKFRQEYISYQLQELKSANLKIGEEQELTDKLKILNNVEKIKVALNDCLVDLDGSSISVLNLLNKCNQNLESVSNFDSRYKNIQTRLNSSRYEIEDCLEELKDCSNSLDFNQDEFNSIDARLDNIKDLKRKFGKSEEELIEYISQLEEENNKIVNSTELLQQYQLKKKDILFKLKDECELLTNKRKEVAKQFESNITKELKDLGMPSSQFSICFKEDETEFEKRLTQNGVDEIEFMFSANLGEPLKPIVKVISGGEASRFMLAFKNVVSETDNIATMVFDEIDTGISGKIAHIVAQKMANISFKHQLICITHLPQIASMADNHFLIKKYEENGHTKTKLITLENEERIVEIARLLGAVDNSELSLNVAKELLQSCDKYKNN